MIVKRKTAASPEQIEANLKKALDKLKGGSTTVLARIQSNTKDDVWYEIRLGMNNAVYCTCKGFQYRQKCDHMKTFRKQHVTQKIGR